MYKTSPVNEGPAENAGLVSSFEPSYQVSTQAGISNLNCDDAKALNLNSLNQGALENSLNCAFNFNNAFSAFSSLASLKN